MLLDLFRFTIFYDFHEFFPIFKRTAYFVYRYKNNVIFYHVCPVRAATNDDRNGFQTIVYVCR